MPIQCEYYALEGLGPAPAQRRPGAAQPQPRARGLSTIVLVMYDARTKLADQVVQRGARALRRQGLPQRSCPARCGSRRRRRSGSRSSRSIRARRGAIAYRRAGQGGQRWARRSGLGKGLGALIPPPSVTRGHRCRRCARCRSRRSRRTRYQPREHFDEEALVEPDRVDPASWACSSRSWCARSAHGPLRADRGGAALAGRQAGRAADHPGHRARRSTTCASLEQALVENLHREDLNPLEEAAAYQQLIEDFGLTQEEVAQRVGKSRSAVANTLRLLPAAPAASSGCVAEGQISAGHARALLGTPDRVFQEQLARAIVAEQPDGPRGRGARSAAHDAASRGAATRPPTATPAPSEPAAVRAPAGPARARGAARRPPRHPRAGRRWGAEARAGWSIEFADLEDLERIYRVIDRGPEPTD